MGNTKFVASVLIFSAVLVGLLTLWHNARTDSVNTALLETDKTLDGPLVAEEQEVNNPVIKNEMNPIAIITTNKGVIELELFEDKMPITVGNFVSLSESGFYDSTKFHRVIDGFMIQGGDPNSKGDNESIYGQGGPEENVQDEFVKDPLLSNARGTIAMANTGQPNSGGSQWFINLVDNVGLDFDKEPLSSKHPVFGRVISGMEVVDAIGSVDTKERDIPVEPIVIESVRIARK